MWKVVFREGISNIEAVVIFQIGCTSKLLMKATFFFCQTKKDEGHLDSRSPSLFLFIGIYVTDLQTVKERD